MAQEDCRLCMFPDLQNKSDDFSVVDGPSNSDFGRTGPLPLLVFKTVN